jgi:type I restriction enzyme R subunit
LASEVATDASLPDNLRVDIVHLAEEIVVDIADHAGLVRFWHNPHAQDELRRRVIQTLDDRDLFPFAEQAVVADKVMELARANQPLIAQRAGGGRRP